MSMTAPPSECHPEVGHAAASSAKKPANDFVIDDESETGLRMVFVGCDVSSSLQRGVT